MRHRWSHGWTQRDLAREARLNPKTIEAIEAGNSPGSPKTAKKLADALGISITEIIEEEEEGCDAPIQAETG